MTDEFYIPAKPDDLLNEDVDLPLKIRRLHTFDIAAAAEVEEYAEGKLRDDALLCLYRCNYAETQHTRGPTVATERLGPLWCRSII